MRRKHVLWISLLLCALFVGAVLRLRLPAAGPVSVRAEARADGLLPDYAGEVRTALELLPDEKLNVNTASAEELEKLPGIGPELSEAIVRWRAEHGPFERPEDLMEVPGIGQARYEAVADSITVEETP